MPASPSLQSMRLPDPKATRILIGEGNFINFTVIKKMLEKLGYDSIFQAESGPAAVAMATAESFQFIFLDLRLPIIGGMEVTKLIRKHEKDNQKPESANIIGLTAVYTEKDADFSICYSTGIDAVLRMPLRIIDLRSALLTTRKKPVETLKNLILMYITNQPQIFQYTTTNPNTIYYTPLESGEESGEYPIEKLMPCDVMEELHNMKDIFPTYYKYPKFEDLDISEILCIIPIDYEILSKGVLRAIKSGDMLEVRRCATALATILQHISTSSYSAAVALSLCDNAELARNKFRELKLYMHKAWE